MPPKTAPTIPPKRVLPSKEAGLFKELLMLYETRQLKKGLKTADQILKKHPEHGETLCMKGLVLTHMGRRDEGSECVKRGVRLDLTSHICWHVFGLIQKGEKKYEDALKSYTQALRFDKDNMNILRDAAHLQTQLRIFDGLVETRHTLVQLRPNLRQNWMGLAVAYHLNGNLQDAKKVLEYYERTLKNVPDYDIEHSETLLYHIRVLTDLGEHADALILLDSCAKDRTIVDRIAIMETRAQLLSALDRKGDAEHAWRALVDQNADNYGYLRGYLSVRHIDIDNLTDETRVQALDVLKELCTSLPRGTAPRRLALDVATGDEFRDLADTYIRTGLVKGIPSLFADLKPLYADRAKRATILSIAESVHAAPDPEPSAYLWTLYFLAQHHAQPPADTRRALALLDEALTHTPTLPELHTLRARVLKRAGDPFGAARALEDARALDGQDRFLNTKSGKYLLRADCIEAATAVFGLFTKKDAASPAADLEDMQSLLFLTEEAAAYSRIGHRGMALKRYMAVIRIFDEIEDDQYDFHGYSLRKFNINVYLDLIAWEDKVRSHPAYIKSALAASQIFVEVHDDPSLAAPPSSNSNMTDAQKKAKKKAKKAAQKSQPQTDPKKPQSSNEDKGLEPTPTTDEDPEGTTLAKATDGLERAAKALRPLAALCPANVDMWITDYDVAVRRKKYLQAVRALNHARALDPEHPELHVRLVHFRLIVEHERDSIVESLRPLVDACVATDLPVDTYNSQYLQRHAGDARYMFAAAQVSKLAGASLDEVEEILFNVIRPEVQVDIPTALSIVNFLQILKSARIEEFRQTCDGRFKFSTVFKPATELEKLRRVASEDSREEQEGREKFEAAG